MASAGVDILEMLPDATAEVSGTFTKKKAHKNMFIMFILIIITFLFFCFFFTFCL